MNFYTFPGIKKNNTCRLSMDEIIDIVANHFNVHTQTMSIKSRKREIVVPRQFSQAMIRNYLPWVKLKDIGEAIGNKDHATVLHSKKVVYQTYQKDKTYIEDFLEITSQIEKESLVKYMKELERTELETKKLMELNEKILG